MLSLVTVANDVPHAHVLATVLARASEVRSLAMLSTSYDYCHNYMTILDYTCSYSYAYL